MAYLKSNWSISRSAHAKYLVEPLQLDGAYFGTPANELDRVARLIIQPKPEKSASTQVENLKATDA